MPYDASKEKQTEYGMIPKNDRGDYIRVSQVLNTSNNSISLDVRTFFTPEGKEPSPTSKGVRIGSKSIVEVMRSMYNAMPEAEQAEFKSIIL